jgi:hypothetical protein
LRFQHGSARPQLYDRLRQWFPNDQPFTTTEARSQEGHSASGSGKHLTDGDRFAKNQGCQGEQESHLAPHDGLAGKDCVFSFRRGSLVLSLGLNSADSSLQIIRRKLAAEMLLLIEDMFRIKDRGDVATGAVASSPICVGDRVWVPVPSGNS